MTRNEWLSGPQTNLLFSPYVALSDVMPSRFVLAYDDISETHLEVAFLALDAERLGQIVNDGSSSRDLGDNQLVNHVASMREFLSSNHPIS